MSKFNLKDWRVIGTIVLVSVLMVSSAAYLTITDFRNIWEGCRELNPELRYCIADVFLEDEREKVHILTRNSESPEGFSRFTITHDEITVYGNGKNIDANIYPILEYFKTHGKDGWVRLDRQPTLIDLKLSEESNLVKVVRETPYYATASRSSKGGVLIETFTLPIDAESSMKWDVEFDAIGSRQNSDNAVHYEFRDLKTSSHEIWNDNTAIFSNNFQISWSGDEHNIDGLEILSDDRVRLNFVPQRGDFKADPRVVIGSTALDYELKDLRSGLSDILMDIEVTSNKKSSFSKQDTGVIEKFRDNVDIRHLSVFQVRNVTETIERNVSKQVFWKTVRVDEGNGTFDKPIYNESWEISSYQRTVEREFSDISVDGSALIRVRGQREAKLGRSSVDLVPKLGQFELNRFAFFNTSWSKCKNINLEEFHGVGRTNELVFVNLTGLTISSDRFEDEIRIVDTECDSGGAEIVRDVVENSSLSVSDGSRWAYVVFPANVSAGSTANYSAYYDNLDADPPSYVNTLAVSGGADSWVIQPFPSDSGYDFGQTRGGVAGPKFNSTWSSQTFPTSGGYMGRIRSDAGGGAFSIRPEIDTGQTIKRNVDGDVIQSFTFCSSQSGWHCYNWTVGLYQNLSRITHFYGFVSSDNYSAPHPLNGGTTSNTITTSYHDVVSGASTTVGNACDVQKEPWNGWLIFNGTIDGPLVRYYSMNTTHVADQNIRPTFSECDRNNQVSDPQSNERIFGSSGASDPHYMLWHNCNATFSSGTLPNNQVGDGDVCKVRIGAVSDSLTNDQYTDVLTAENNPVYANATLGSEVEQNGNSIPVLDVELDVVPGDDAYEFNKRRTWIINATDDDDDALKIYFTTNKTGSNITVTVGSENTTTINSSTIEANRTVQDLQGGSIIWAWGADDEKGGTANVSGILTITRGSFADTHKFIDGEPKNKTVNSTDTVVIKGNITNDTGGIPAGVYPTLGIYTNDTERATNNSNFVEFSGTFSAGSHQVIFNSSGNINISSFNNQSIFIFSEESSQSIPVLKISNGTFTMNNSGLVAYWRFENDTNKNATRDYSGWGNNLTGNVFELKVVHDDTIGGVGAASLNGSRFSQVNSTSLTNIWDGGGAITFWLKPQSTPSQSIFASKSTNIGNNRWAIIALDAAGSSDNELVFSVAGSNNWYTTDWIGYDNAGNWVHIGVSWNGTSGTTPGIFFNGKNATIVQASSATSVDDTNEKFYVGGSDASPGTHTGLMDEMTVWNRSLTPDEIRFLYSSDVRSNHSNSGVEFTETNQDDGDVTYSLFRNGNSISNPDAEFLDIGEYFYLGNSTEGSLYYPASFYVLINRTQKYEPIKAEFPTGTPEYTLNLSTCIGPNCFQNGTYTPSNQTVLSDTASTHDGWIFNITNLIDSTLNITLSLSSAPPACIQIYLTNDSTGIRDMNPANHFNLSTATNTVYWDINPFQNVTFWSWTYLNSCAIGTNYDFNFTWNSTPFS